MIIQIYSGKSSYDGKIVTGQLIAIKGRYYIANDSELGEHSFYAVNPDAFEEVLEDSIKVIV